MAMLKINNTDFSSFVAAQKVAYEVLLSEDSGRNAYGNNVVDIVNRKIKISCSIKPLTAAQMSSFLNAIHPYVVSVTYLDSKSNDNRTISCYVSTAEPEKYGYVNGVMMYKPMEISFVEM